MGCGKLLVHPRYEGRGAQGVPWGGLGAFPSWHSSGGDAGTRGGAAACRKGGPRGRGTRTPQRGGCHPVPPTCKHSSRKAVAGKSELSSLANPAQRRCVLPPPAPHPVPLPASFPAPPGPPHAQLLPYASCSGAAHEVTAATASPRRPPPQLPFATSGWHRGDTSELHTGAHGSGTQRWAGRGTQHPTPPSHRPTPPAAGSTKRCFAVPLPPKRSKAVRFFAPPPRRTLCSPPRGEDPPGLPGPRVFAVQVHSEAALGAVAVAAGLAGALGAREPLCRRAGTVLQCAGLAGDRAPICRASTETPTRQPIPQRPGDPRTERCGSVRAGRDASPRVCACVCAWICTDPRCSCSSRAAAGRGPRWHEGCSCSPPARCHVPQRCVKLCLFPPSPPAHTHTHTHTHPLAVIQAVPGVWISVTTYQQGREGEFKPVRPSSAPSRLPALLRAQRRWHRAQPRRNAPLLLPGVELHRGQCGAGKYVLERPVESLMNLLMCPELRAVGGESGRKEANRRLSRTAAGSRSPPHTLRAAPWGERGTAASRDPVPRGPTPRRPHHPLCAPGCRRGLHGAPRRTGARGPPRAGAPRHARTRGPTGAISPRRPPAPAHVAGDEALRPALCRRSARPTDPPAAPHPEPWGRAAPGSPQQHRAGMLAAPPRSLSPPLLSPRQRPHVSH